MENNIIFSLVSVHDFQCYFKIYKETRHFRPFRARTLFNLNQQKLYAIHCQHLYLLRFYCLQKNIAYALFDPCECMSNSPRNHKLWKSIYSIYFCPSTPLFFSSTSSFTELANDRLLYICIRLLRCYEFICQIINNFSMLFSFKKS